MTDYADLVQQIYKRELLWSNVAYEMQQNGSRHDRSYWWGIANKTLLNPDKKAKSAVRKYATIHSLLVRATYRNAGQRKNITVSTTLYNRLNALKRRNSETWEQLISRALEALEGEE